MLLQNYYIYQRKSYISSELFIMPSSKIIVNMETEGVKMLCMSQII